MTFFLIMILGLLCSLSTVQAQFPPIYLNGKPHLIDLAEPCRTESQNRSLSCPIPIDVILAKPQKPEKPYTAVIIPFTYHVRIDNVLLHFRAPFTFISHNFGNNNFVFSNNTQFSISNFGVNDLNLMLGYRFYSSSTALLSAYFDLVIPAPYNNKVYHPLEPTMGSLGYLSPGAYVHAAKQLWGREEHNIMGDASVAYHYQLNGKNNHFLKINRAPARVIDLPVSQEDLWVIPTELSSVSLCSVSPNSTVDAAVNFAYTYHVFFANLGCFYHFAQQENLFFNYPITNLSSFDRFVFNGRAVDKRYIVDQRNILIPACQLIKLSLELGVKGNGPGSVYYSSLIRENFYALFGGSIMAMHEHHPDEWSIFCKFGFTF